MLIESPHDFAGFTTQLAGHLESDTLARVRNAFHRHRDQYDRGTSAAWFWTRVADDAGAPAPGSETIQALVGLEQRRWSSPAPATLAALQRCRVAGHSLAILSNAPHELDETLRTAGWSQIFDLVMTSAQLGVAKPDDEVWAVALGRMGARAKDVSFFDDRGDNVEAAASCGIDAHRWIGLNTLKDLLQLY